jgi:hypothetical protein
MRTSLFILLCLTPVVQGFKITEGFIVLESYYYTPTKQCNTVSTNVMGKTLNVCSSTFDPGSGNMSSFMYLSCESNGTHILSDSIYCNETMTCEGPSCIYSSGLTPVCDSNGHSTKCTTNDWNYFAQVEWWTL